MDNTALLKQKILELESQLIAEHKAEEILSEMDTIDQIPEFFKFLFEKMPKSLGVPFVYHFVNIEKPYRREEDIRNLWFIFRASLKEFFSENSEYINTSIHETVKIYSKESLEFKEGKSYLPLIIENAIIGNKKEENTNMLLGYIEFDTEKETQWDIERRTRIIRKILRAVRTHLERIRSYILMQEHSLLAYQDTLTEIYNRRGFFRDCKHTRLNHGHTEWGVIVLDLDFFKRINDTYGHADGDRALKFTTKTIQEVLSHIKETSTNVPVFGRVGGEEFAIYLHKTDCVRAREIGEMLRKALEDGHFILSNNERYQLTGSFGIYACTEDESVESGLAKADIALYEAKRNGRNRVEIFQKEILIKHDSHEKIQVRQ